MMRLQGPDPLCYSLTDVSLIGFECGIAGNGTHYCQTNNTCADARAYECNTTLECTLDIPLTVPATYSTPYATTYVLQYPHIATLCTSVSCAIPLTATTETALFFTLAPALDANSTRVSLILDAFSGLISLNSTFFVPYGIAVDVVPIPVMYSLCPSLMLSSVNSTVVVQGADFTAGVLCFFNGQNVPVQVLNANVIHCTAYIETNTTGNYPITVSNDLGASFASTTLYVSVIGECRTIKPNSVAVGNACLCPPGFMDIDNSACIPCGNGDFQPQYGQGICLSCGETMDTGGRVGATNQSECVCKAGYFANPMCEPCTRGMDCSVGGGKVGVLPGFWRYSESDMYAVECPGGHTWCAGGFGAGESLCATGYTAPLCSSCASGYGGFNNACVSCYNQSVNMLIVFIMLSVCLVAIFGMAYFSRTEISSVDNGIHDDKITVGPIIKIMFNYLQSLYYIGQINSGWSATSRGFFVAFVPLSISTSFVSIKCAFEMGFYAKMALVMVQPLMVTSFMIFVMLLLNIAFSRLGIHTFTEVEGKSVLLISLYLVHPSIALDILQSLSCEAVKGTGTSFVTTDMRIDCGSAEYKQYRVIAILYFLLYIVGSCLFIGHKLSIYRDELHKLLAIRAYWNGNDQLSIYMYFFQGYRAGSISAAWEMVVILRKIAIVAVSALFAAEIGLVWATFILFICFMSTLHKLPYQPFIKWNLDYNYHEMASLSAQLFTLFLAFYSLYYSRGGVSNLASDSAVAILIFMLLVLVNGLIFMFMLSAIFIRVRTKISSAISLVSRLADCCTENTTDSISASSSSSASSTTIILQSRETVAKSRQTVELNQIDKNEFTDIDIY
jgi:hypothetical protein